MPSSEQQILADINEIVAIPSVSSADPGIDTSNAKVIHFLSNRLEQLGLACEEIPATTTNGNPKLNLLASLGSGPGGLVLAGHTDTVPFDAALWQSDPFSVAERDNRLYGLGVTDMKGFFAVVMEALRPLLNETFREPLFVLATADEETSMEGARAMARLGRPKARAAVIGEPTSLKPVRAHKGIMMESIRILGQSGHSSNPALGKNALEAMHVVISELMKYRLELKDRFANPLFEIPYPTLNLGVIHGGDNPNRICGHCKLEFDIRVMPGMYIDEVREEIRKRANSAVANMGIKCELVPLFDGTPAFTGFEDSPLLARAEALSGSEPITVAFGTEAPYLQELGMDTIVMGPGSIDQAHQPDEYMALDMINPAVEILRRLIIERCIEPGAQS